MARTRGSIQKRCKYEDTRRQTRRERLHQLCSDAANASISNHNWILDPPLTITSDWHPNRNQFEPLARFHDCQSTWFAKRQSRRRRARGHKRKGLVELQLSALNAESSTQFDNVITTSDHNPNVQLPHLDFSPMQVVKWQPSALSPLHTPTTRCQSTSDADWSRLEINFSPPPTKTSCPPLPSPPIALMTAAELGLVTPLTPKACLPTLRNISQATASTPSNAPIVTPWTPQASVLARTSQSPCLPMEAPVEGDIASSFVAAKLPYFHHIDPFDLTIPSDFDLGTNSAEHLHSQPRSTRCTLPHEDDYDLDESSLNSSQSLLNCEEGGMPGLVHTESTTAQAYALEVGWDDAPVVDWPYDILGDWDNEPFLDWNGEPAADWIDQAVDEYFDDLVMIEHDAETYDWTFLPQDRAPSDCISVFSSRFSSMEVLPLPLRDSFMEETSAYEGPIRELAESELNIRRVTRSAWDSESDFCIPAFF